MENKIQVQDHSQEILSVIRSNALTRHSEKQTGRLP